MGKDLILQRRFLDLEAYQRDVAPAVFVIPELNVTLIEFKIGSEKLYYVLDNNLAQDMVIYNLATGIRSNTKWYKEQGLLKDITQITYSNELELDMPLLAMINALIQLLKRLHVPVETIKPKRKVVFVNS